MINTIKWVFRSQSPYVWHYRLFSFICLGLMVWSFELNHPIFWVALFFGFASWMLSYSIEAFGSGIGVWFAFQFAPDVYATFPETWARFQKAGLIALLFTLIAFLSYHATRMILSYIRRKQSEIVYNSAKLNGIPMTEWVDTWEKEHKSFQQTQQTISEKDVLGQKLADAEARTLAMRAEVEAWEREKAQEKNTNR